ncbi:MAG: hypothetical protein HN348_04050 [Proteobacteria bacterium]|nr:hypothetical protein [Pseudomonadota bacterium]
MSLLLICAVVATGCHNSCQTICLRMAKYADECGYSVPDADIDSCMADYANAVREDLKVCSQYNGSESIQVEWSCDDLGIYWGADTEGDDDDED